MLTNLSIKNIVLVEQLDIGFAEGFTVLTGETGAGKSILLDALSLAIGERAETRLVRSGEKQGTVTSEFDIKGKKNLIKILDEQGIEVEDSLILRRIIQADGKSRAFINDSPISITLLKEIGEHLVEIHGQHEQAGLLNTSTHKEIIDAYAKAEKQLEKTAEAFKKWQDAKKMLAEKKEQAEKVKAEEDYLRHAIKELSDLNPQVGEEEKLAEQRRILMQREKIIGSLQMAVQEITQNKPVAEALRAAQRTLYRNTQAGDVFTKAIDALDKAANETEEAVGVLEKLSESLNPENSSLEQVEDRLFSLREAARKYRKTVDELPALHQELSAQLSLIDSKDNALTTLENEVKQAKNSYSIFADELSVLRAKAAKKIEKVVADELAPLKLSASSFRVNIESLSEESWNSEGKESIRFEVKTNAGSPFGPLNKIASGGELSRFMLALKVVLLDISKAGTIIFDEIDAGIGGAVADAVGKRLAELGKKQQVLVVTHQPQVAAYGTNNMFVSKEVKNNKTITSIKTLSEKEKKEELARMLAGAKVTDEARAAALALMDS